MGPTLCQNIFIAIRRRHDQNISITIRISNSIHFFIITQITNVVLNSIIDGNLSFNVIQSPSFKKLLETVAGRTILIPSNYKVMNHLDSEFIRTKTKLMEVIAQQDFVCLTADVWSSRAQSYLGVTVHFIDQCYQRQSYGLAFKELKYKQTYKELTKSMHDIFNDFNLNIAKITNIGTDGGSAFCKMFKVYGDEPRSESEDREETSETEDVDMDQENLSRVNQNQTFMSDLNGDFFASEIINFNIDPAIETTSLESTRTESNRTSMQPYFEENSNSDSNMQDYFGNREHNENEQEVQPKLPGQRRCVSHQCNLLHKYFYDELKGFAKSSLTSAINKLHSLWVLTHRSSRAKSICKDILGVCLLVPCETRWNSQYDAVKKCLSAEIQPNINKLIETLKNDIDSAANLSVLGQNDFIVLSNYLKVMGPVAQSLDKLQGEVNNSQGLILPVLKSMKYRIEQLDDTSNIAKDFKAAMLKVIDKRFGNYLEFNASIKDLILTSITLPTVKNIFLSSDDELIYAKNLLIIECKKIQAESTVNAVDHDANIATENTTQDDFLIEFRGLRNMRISSTESDIESEVARFIADSRSEISILNEYPKIKKVYYKFNTTLSSSAPVERLFSQSSMIFTPRRNRLSSVKFEQALMLKVNRKLLED